MSDEQIKTALYQLQRSDRGTAVLNSLAGWMNAYAFGLDQQNQEAILTLLQAVWSSRSGSAWSLICEAVED